MSKKKEITFILVKKHKIMKIKQIILLIIITCMSIDNLHAVGPRVRKKISHPTLKSDIDSQSNAELIPPVEEAHLIDKTDDDEKAIVLFAGFIAVAFGIGVPLFTILYKIVQVDKKSSALDARLESLKHNVDTNMSTVNQAIITVQTIQKDMENQADVAEKRTQEIQAQLNEFKTNIENYKRIGMPKPGPQDGKPTGLYVQRRSGTTSEPETSSCPSVPGRHILLPK